MNYQVNVQIYIAYWMHEFISKGKILRFKMQVIWSKMYFLDSSLIQGANSREGNNDKISGKAWGRVKVMGKQYISGYTK